MYGRFARFRPSMGTLYIIDRCIFDEIWRYDVCISHGTSRHSPRTSACILMNTYDDLGYDTLAKIQVAACQKHGYRRLCVRFRDYVSYVDPHSLLVKACASFDVDILCDTLKEYTEIEHAAEKAVCLRFCVWLGWTKGVRLLLDEGGVSPTVWMTEPDVQNSTIIRHYSAIEDAMTLRGLESITMLKELLREAQSVHVNDTLYGKTAVLGCVLMRVLTQRAAETGTSNGYSIGCDMDQFAFYHEVTSPSHVLVSAVKYLLDLGANLGSVQSDVLRLIGVNDDWTLFYAILSSHLLNSVRSTIVTVFASIEIDMWISLLLVALLFNLPVSSMRSFQSALYEVKLSPVQVACWFRDAGRVGALLREGCHLPGDIKDTILNAFGPSQLERPLYNHGLFNLWSSRSPVNPRDPMFRVTQMCEELKSCADSISSDRQAGNVNYFEILSFSPRADVEAAISRVTLPWSPQRHRYHPDENRAKVELLLMVRHKLENSHALPVLPLELWFHIFSFICTGPL
jgi:hypothetical protein